jgi:hypothetical protein
MLLEQMLKRDSSPSTLAFALPLLRRIVEATAGTDIGLALSGVLAVALRLAGCTDMAEQMLRDVIAASVARGTFQVASSAADQLLHVLVDSGRLTEALTAAAQMAGYTRQAGLGPWSQLSDEGRRLEVLNAMGRFDEVLAAVERLRPQLDSLLERGELDEVNPWNVRESLLYAGVAAAAYSERYEAALELNAEIVRGMQSRGADALELARARFNDYGPLLRLRRYDAARQLLVSCRAVFEVERHIGLLGSVYSALADLEFRTGGRAEAVRFEQIALAYAYQEGQPENCAFSHGNIATYMEEQGQDPAEVSAHRLATAVIFSQIQSGRLAIAARHLANSTLPDAPPAFADVVARVEAIKGVRFAALFDRLPRTAPDGDAAIATVWQLVAEERSRRGAESQKVEAVRSAVTSMLPPELLAAIESGDESQFAAALAQLSPEQRQALMEQMQSAMQQAGIEVPESSGPEMNQVLQNFAPLLQAIAAVALGDDGPREQIEAALPELEQDGWQLTDAVHRIWAGERDAEALTAGRDEQDAQLIRHILDLLA